MTRINVVAVIAGCVVLLAAQSRAEETPSPIRIGTYDSRAIAIAYARSTHSPMRERMRAFRAAKAAGDTARVRELREWGQMNQRKLHFQGFGRYPVVEYIEVIRESLPEIMARHGLHAIVWMCHEQGKDVETVDVTMDMVKAFGADARVVQMVEGIGDVEPEDFATLFAMDPKH